jgi:hypothetical protein
LDLHQFIRILSFKENLWKTNKKYSRPILALFGSVCIIASRIAEYYKLNILDLGLLFMGSFIFGWIFESIKIERRASRDE